MLPTGTIWWRNTKDWKHTKQYRHHNRTKNGFRKSKKQSNVLSNSGYKPWYYATLLRIWGWTFKGCKQIDPTPSFFPCDYEYSWRIRKSQTHRDAESLVKNWEKNRKFETDKSFRDSLQKLSRSWDWWKCFLPSERNGRGKPHSERLFLSREAAEWLWGRKYCMVWTLRMRTISL